MTTTLAYSTVVVITYDKSFMIQAQRKKKCYSVFFLKFSKILKYEIVLSRKAKAVTRLSKFDRFKLTKSLDLTDVILDLQFILPRLRTQ